MKNAALLSCIALVAAAPASAEPLQPAGKWIVDFGDNRCLAARTFGPANNPVHLLIKPSPVGDVLQLSVAETGRRATAAEQEPMKLRLDAGEALAIWQLRYSVEGKQVRLINLTKEQAGQLSKATSIQWSAKLREYDLAVGPMKNLVKVIEECRATLAAFWNATPEKEATLKSGPAIDRPIVSLFSTDDYPSQAVSKFQSGMAKVVALIDEKGQIADCSVVEPSGVAVLDAQTCIVMRKRAKFTPAIGADGKPAKAVFTQRIRWEIS